VNQPEQRKYAGHEAAESAVFFLRPFLLWFDRAFFRFRDGYVKLVGHALARKLRYGFVYVVIVAGLGFLFMRMPTGYLPDEDQGILLARLSTFAVLASDSPPPQ
jgi:HAE1 family hydrophobic/amphiphilic exporter-1